MLNDGLYLSYTVLLNTTRCDVASLDISARHKIKIFVPKSQNIRSSWQERIYSMTITRIYIKYNKHFYIICNKKYLVSAV